MKANTRVRLILWATAILVLCVALCSLGETELVQLEHGVCFHNASYFDGSQPVFSSIEESDQSGSMSFIKPIAATALLGKQFTGYLQLHETLSTEPVPPFGGGTFSECELGCVKEFTYFGVMYRDICIHQICNEGSINNKEAFCASDLSPDIYYMHQMFWCGDYPRVAMFCGEGAHCVDTDEGPKCRTYSQPEARVDGGGLAYELVLPRTPDGLVAVVAMYDGYEIARRNISSLSLGEMLAQSGPIDARLAQSYAQETGLSQEATSVLRSMAVYGLNREIRGALAPSLPQWGLQCSVP